MKRRTFIATTGTAATALSLAGPQAWTAPKKNKLPQWKGFNLLDFFSPDPNNTRPERQKIISAGCETGDLILSEFQWLTPRILRLTEPGILPLTMSIKLMKKL